MLPLTCCLTWSRTFDALVVRPFLSLASSFVVAQTPRTFALPPTMQGLPPNATYAVDEVLHLLTASSAQTHNALTTRSLLKMIL